MLNAGLFACLVVCNRHHGLFFYFTHNVFHGYYHKVEGTYQPKLHLKINYIHTQGLVISIHNQYFRQAWSNSLKLQTKLLRNQPFLMLHQNDSCKKIFE